MKKTLLFPVLLLNIIAVTAQLENSISGSVSIAETSVADSKNWTAFHNPAMLGYLAETEVGVIFENRFFIKELSTKLVQAAIHTESINVGISFSHFGYSVYHDILAGATFARNFGNRFGIGVQFNYFTSYFVQENKYGGALLGQIGVNMRVTNRFSLGFV
jgi:hypothetical protein